MLKRTALANPLGIVVVKHIGKKVDYWRPETQKPLEKKASIRQVTEVGWNFRGMDTDR